MKLIQAFAIFSFVSMTSISAMAQSATPGPCDDIVNKIDTGSEKATALSKAISDRSAVVDGLIATPAEMAKSLADAIDRAGSITLDAQYTPGFRNTYKGAQDERSKNTQEKDSQLAQVEELKKLLTQTQRCLIRLGQ